MINLTVSFGPTAKKSLCRMPNITVQAEYLLPIILDYTLIDSKKINMGVYIHCKYKQ